MSHSGELFTVRDDVTSGQRFETALRGYDKRQVDLYVSRVDHETSRLLTERERAIGQVQDVSAKLRQVQAEVTELRQRPQVPLDKASFRDLGPMVDQILALAEKQAGVITSTTAERAAKRQAEAEQVLAEAQERAVRTLHDLDVELAARRAAEERAHEERRAAAEAELAGIREHAEQVRAEGEAARDRAEQEATRLAEQGAQGIERARAEALAIVEAARAQAEREGGTIRARTQQELAQLQADVEREVDQRRTAAGQKIVTLHAEAQQHAAEVRRRSDEESAAHQEQLTGVQRDIETRRQELAKVQAELDSAEQHLARSREERASTDQEVTELQQRLGEVRQELTAGLARLDETRRAADAAEQHAKVVRARVQQEAKRVAQLAAAAVMAAAMGGDTGEFPKVVLGSANGEAVPAPREPQQDEVSADAE